MEKLSQKPSIVIVSSSSTKPKSLIKLITGTTNVIEDDEPNKVSHPWQIDTKYYSANVNIHGITEGYVRTDEFNDSVEAFIIHMDSNRESGLGDIEKWGVIENDCDPEIKLLVSNYCTSETKITRAKATEWCLKRGFELIELYPSITKCSEDEEDEIIKEKTGVDRIVEALQTHIWSNLIMKEKLNVGVNNAKHENDIENQDIPNASNKLQTANIGIDSSLLNDFLTNEGADDFTELFSQLHMIKESIKTMPASQRKQCAEQMVTAFWRAIGGDEEEIADI